MRTLPSFAAAAAALLLVSLLVACAGYPLQAPGTAHANDAQIQHLVSEDDAVRIDELRVRGHTQRLTVNPKGSGAPAYEIQPAAGGSDPSKGRDGAGQRLWQVLSF